MKHLCRNLFYGKGEIMKKKVVLTCMSLLCCVMLASCGTANGNENQDPLTGEEMSGTQNTQNEATTEQGTANTDEFGTLLNQSENPSDVIHYINTNIGTAAEADVNRFLTGLLSFGNDIRDIDFTQLDESKQYMPEDMIAFMELMKLEADTPSMVMSNEENRRVIGLTLSEMLERALLFEQHIQKYPNGVSTEAAEQLYEEIATHAITGGYDKTAGISHYYQGETENVVDKDSLQYYQQFAEANSDSNLGAIVKDYINTLQSTNFQISDEMEDFYRSLPQRLQIAGNVDTGVTNGAAGNTNDTGVTNGTTGTTNGTGVTNGATGTTNGTGVTNGTGTTNTTTGSRTADRKSVV